MLFVTNVQPQSTDLNVMSLTHAHTFISSLVCVRAATVHLYLLCYMENGKQFSGLHFLVLGGSFAPSSFFSRDNCVLTLTTGGFLAMYLCVYERMYETEIKINARTACVHAGVQQESDFWHI